jgi:hypothetical protein
MNNKHARILLLCTRWTARLTGVLLLALVLLLHIGQRPPLRILVSPIHIGIWLTLFGLVIGWKYEGLGAALALVAPIAMYGYELAVWHHFLGGAFPLFFIPGILLLVTKVLAIRLGPPPGLRLPAS